MSRRVASSLVLPPDRWRHPWHHALSWDYARRRWQALITPGFVNELDATISMPANEAPAVTLKRLPQDLGSQPIDVWLTEEPTLPIDQFRAIGTDDQGKPIADEDGQLHRTFANVPPFFLARGVGAPVTGTGGLPAADPSTVRLLRACDVALYLDILNLFLFLLRLMSPASRSRKYSTRSSTGGAGSDGR